jgi:hypothetical protein
MHTYHHQHQPGSLDGGCIYDGSELLLGIVVCVGAMTIQVAALLYRRIYSLRRSVVIFHVSLSL